MTKKQIEKTIDRAVQDLFKRSMGDYFRPVEDGGGEWFSIKDALPAEKMPVEMKYQKGKEALCWHVVQLMDGKWYSPDGSGPVGYPITHWRPLEHTALTA